MNPLTLVAILLYLLLYGGIGAALFSVIVLIFCRTGVAWAERGEVKRTVGSIIILGGLISLQLLANFFGLKLQNFSISFGELFMLNYGLYLLLFLFDTLVIDILVIVKWHPAFLQLPETEVATSVKYHLKTIPIGIVLGLAITLIPSLISYFLVL